MEIGRQAVEMTLLLAAPLLLAALLIGLIVSVFQAATQINEQTLSFIPKLVGVFLILLAGRPLDAAADGRLRAPTVREHSPTDRLKAGDDQPQQRPRSTPGSSPSSSRWHASSAVLASGAAIQQPGTDRCACGCSSAWPITLGHRPGAAADAGVDPASGAGLLLLAQQMLIGFAMGFAMRLVFSRIDLAGSLISLQMGLGFASSYDPQTAGQTGVVSEFLGLLALLVFMAINGHLMVIATLTHSFI
jgi:type III secretory pathway component EscS